MSLREQFEIDVSELGEKIHQLGLEELEVRENEIKVFEESLEIAREESQRKGVLAVKKYWLTLQLWRDMIVRRQEKYFIEIFAPKAYFLVQFIKLFLNLVPFKNYFWFGGMRVPKCLDNLFHLILGI